jgi:alpha-1,3-mannosylglycoprotein beta-1,4-N-acetylglucosaminyltransferase A/B
MGVDLVIGIPTIKREKEDYLPTTLQSLFENMNLEESKKCLVIIYIGDINETIVMKTINLIQTEFGVQLDNGLLEIVAPDPNFFPNNSKLR